MLRGGKNHGKPNLQPLDAGIKVDEIQPRIAPVVIRW
jgi:hypothetical protein